MPMRDVVAPAGGLKDQPPYDEIGREPGVEGFHYDEAQLVGECAECGQPIVEHTTGHVCADGWRDHPDGESVVEGDR